MQTIQKLVRQLMTTDESDHIYARIVEEIQKQDMLWAAFSPVTKNYYTGKEHGEYAAYLFSEKPFAEQFQKELTYKNIDITIVENKAANRTLLFADLMRIGITVLLIDNGQHYVAVSLFEVLDALRNTAPTDAQRLVMNPRLLASAHYFYQQVNCSRATTADELAMFQEIHKSVYLTPIQMNNGTPSLPTLRREDGSCLMMFFTDWPELRRYDRNQECEYKIVRFQDVKVFLQNMDGIVVNPYGVSIVLDKEMFNAVEQAANGTLSLPAKQITMGEESIKITSVSDDAQEMLDAASQFLQDKKEINAAYLRLISRDFALRPSYLIVLDTSAYAETLLQEMAELLMPLTKGLDIEFVSYREPLGRMAAEDEKPFYKKKRFRLFG